MTNILVVDDDALFGHMLLEWLTKRGYHVDRVTSAEEALAWLQTAAVQPEIFLVDQRLGPGMDGVDLILELRSRCPDAEAVLFTGLDDADIARRAYLAGAYRYLQRPFHPDELVWILEAVQQWQSAKTASYERDWLRILNDVAQDLQKANTVVQVSNILIDGGLRLGFDRVRFYKVHAMNGVPTMFGISQGGRNQVKDFQNLIHPIEKTVYSKVAFERREPVFFNNRELGPSFLSKMSHANGQPEELGEWVSIPLLSGERCISILNMDNAEHKRTIHLQRKDLLRLFAGQASAALERALRAEQEQQERQTEQMAQRILQRMGDPAKPGSLDQLLQAIRDEFAPMVQVSNFLVALRGKNTDGYYTRLHIEAGQICRPCWRPATRRGMVWCLLNHGSPLFLPAGTAEHRRHHKLELVGDREACSWMGVPLKIGDNIVGAMAMEDDEHRNIYQAEHFALLQKLADRLAGVIQTAWLNEQQRELNDLLQLLQEASETIMVLGLENEDWLWNATLTLATADYGASFDRAMLFLIDKDGDKLQGRMAIGHLKWEDAQRDWEEYAKDGVTWQIYLNALQANQIKPTPLDGAIRSFSIKLRDDALGQVLKTGKSVIVQKTEVKTRLPRSFIKRFGETTYFLLPVKTGDRIIGLVVLDNLWKKDPQKVGALSYLDTLLRQAALIYEDVRKTKAQEQLIKIQHEILVQAVNRPLRETLLRICQAIQDIAGADMATIYPLQDNDLELLYDYDQVASVGRRASTILPGNRGPTTLSKEVLDGKTPMLVPDVLQDTRQYRGSRLAELPIIQQQGVRAFIGVPIFGFRTGKPRGLLFIDYRTPRHFSDEQREMAEAFAHLAAVAISNWREAQGLRESKEAREAELSQLGEVLEQALSAESDERQIVTLMLEKVYELFAPLSVTTGITLKEWQRHTPESEPVEMHHYYIYQQEHNGVLERWVSKKEDVGISSRAMATGVIQNVADVSTEPTYRECNSTTRSELDAPIILDGQIIGVLNVESPITGAFTGHHEAMVKRFTDAAALALGNVRRQNNLRTILNAASAVTGTTKLQETLDKIVAEVRNAVTNLSMLVIWYLDPDSHKPRLGSYFGVRDEKNLRGDSPRKLGSITKGLQLEQPFWQPDVLSDSLFREKSFVQKEEIQSTAVIPLHVRGKTIGVMFFSYRERHDFTEEERRLFPILAEVVATSINDALQLHQTQREQKRLQATQKVTEIISTEESHDQMIANVQEALIQLYPQSRAYIVRYNERTKALDLPPGLERDKLYLAKDSHHFLCRLTAESLRKREKQVQLCRHTTYRTSDIPLYPGMRTSLGATLVSGADSPNGEKRLLGVLMLESLLPDAFDQDDVEIIRNVARQVRVAMVRTEQEANIRFNSTLSGHIAWATPIIHDINRYTGRILRGVERLQAESALSSNAQTVLSKIQQQIHEMSNRVTAVDLRREETQPLEIDALLTGWVRETLHERSVPIEFQPYLRAPGVQVNAYPKALRRVIYDLVRNSMEAMGWDEEEEREKKERRLTLSTVSLRADRSVEVRIHNNGPAIPSEEQSKLFNEIYTNKGDERGVGLLFVRAAVERMGGKVWLESSTEEGGTTFVLRLTVANGQDNLKEG